MKSQSPQIGALSPSPMYQGNKRYQHAVSIPSNRGSVSVVKSEKHITNDVIESQSPQIGALSPSHK